MKQEKYGFVYKWTDSAESKRNIDDKIVRYYIGCHWGTEDDGYICSSRWMRQARKRRPQDFTREILRTNIFTKEELSEEEHKFLRTIKKEELGKRYYNLRNTRFSITEESIKKMSKAKLGKKQSLEHIQSRVEGRKGYRHSEETKQKMGEAQIGDKNHAYGKTPWNKGKKASKETREKSSIAHKGKPSPRKGKHCSEEHKQKIKESWIRRKERGNHIPSSAFKKGQTPWNKGKKKENQINTTNNLVEVTE